MSIHRNLNPHALAELTDMGFVPTTKRQAPRLIFMHDPLADDAGVDATLIQSQRVEVANDVWRLTLYLKDDRLIAYDETVVRQYDQMQLKIYEIDRLPLLFR